LSKYRFVITITQTEWCRNIFRKRKVGVTNGPDRVGLGPTHLWVTGLLMI